MAATSTNILSLPLRRTQPTSLSTALHAYITSSYNQHPSLFTSDLSTIDSLRTSATTITEPHPSHISKLLAYPAQLVWLTTKFPLDVGADFVWYPSLGYHADTATSANNLRFELANVLFNLGVLYCQLGVHANRGSAEGLKAASNHFCSAAGIFRHLRQVVVPEMRATVPEDMDGATLECIEGVMLAQAQECFWATAVKGGYKDALIAKVAIKVAEMYALAEQAGRRSDAISSEWIHHLKAKEGHFGGVANYRAARDALEKRRYGEEVARLRESLICANEGLKEARYISKMVLGDLQGLKVKVEDDAKRAEKDNDMIYLNIVPAKTDMKPIEGAAMVSAKTPPEVADPITILHEGVQIGKPLFSKLVPYSVHLASSIYASRKDETVQRIISDLETLTAEIHSTLQSLNLPGSLQALEKPLGLPAGLVSRAEEIRQQRGIERLRSAMDDITKLKDNDRQIYQEGFNILRSEAEDDDNARKKYGTDRWSRPPSNDVAQHLYKKMTEIEGYLKDAETTDNAVLEKVRQNENVIHLLASSDRDLEDAVPSSRRAAIPPDVEKAATALRNILNELTRLENRRRRKLDTLRQEAADDDVNSELFRAAARLERENPTQSIEATHFEPLFDARLSKQYDSAYALPGTERSEQEQLLNKLTAAQTTFSNARRGDTSNKEREQALQTLENGYFAYKEIVQNLDVGRRFYNDLKGVCAKFKEECAVYARERRQEAMELEGEIVNALPVGGMSLNGKREALESQQQHQQQQQTPSRSTRSSAAPRAVNTRQEQQEIPSPRQEAPKAAPALPSAPVSQVWTPDMPIKFGNAGNAAGQQKSSPAKKSAGGQWDPSQGVRFG